MKRLQIQCDTKPLIMGILNATPDSFSDGGCFTDTDVAVNHALTMIADGADIIDIGGESTRPGSEAVSPKDQIQRVVPIIKALAKQTNNPISIDTTDSQVATAALDAGASIVNDISALQSDDQMAPLIAHHNCPIIIMHMQGTPKDMQQQPCYDNVIDEVKDFLAKRIYFCQSRGIAKEQIIADPGIGFGKTIDHNLSLIKHIDAFHELGVPILMGHSRKGFIGKILDIDNPKDRTTGNAAIVSYCLSKGCQIFRVHDVKQTKQIIKMTAAIEGAI